MYSTLAVLTFAALSGVSSRKITVKNNCKYTIWPGMYTDPNVSSNIPDHKTGWEQAAGATEEVEVPENWAAGRIWARRDCDFSKDGLSACATGNCNGGLECAKSGGTGVPPVTVAEWTLGGPNGPDNYDVSLVDGFNIPMSLKPTADCQEASCPADINASCPPELQLQGPGGVAGCKSACTANLDGNPQDSPNCCSGSHDKPATCPPSGVQDYDTFKGPCKNAYAYAYDESSKTALWTCDVAKKTDYALTFCP